MNKSPQNLQTFGVFCPKLQLFSRKMSITLVFQEKTPLLPKIAENINHNIDPTICSWLILSSS
jgi:hypothetical protein